MNCFWKKAAAGVLSMALLAVSAASTGLTAYAVPVNDPETGWNYQVIYNKQQHEPVCVDLWGYTGHNDNLTVPETFTIPNTSTTLPTKTDHDAFLQENDWFRKVTFKSARPSDSGASIPNGACQYCKYLKEVDIAVSVNSIGYNAFRDCVALEKVTLPNGLKVIGSEVFCDCISLETINLPPTLEIIGRAAFQNCTALDNVIIPYSVTEIGADAFKDTKLNRVVINNPDTVISNTAFPGNVKQFCGPNSEKLKQYAEAHGSTYLPFRLGYIDNDDDIDLRDIHLILEEYTYVSVAHGEGILDETQKLAADINSDGKIDTRDYRLLMSFYVAKNVSKSIDENLSLYDYLLTEG
ncbi:MAG: leucine-rich repeat protein [Oscillospiraceae bacterium]|nr:leucine-rich repeat protein [Oscillospiraceae bacterium]